MFLSNSIVEREQRRRDSVRSFNSVIVNDPANVGTVPTTPSIISVVNYSTGGVNGLGSRLAATPITGSRIGSRRNSGGGDDRSRSRSPGEGEGGLALPTDERTPLLRPMSESPASHGE
jgi:hypothetical protein